MLALDTIMKDSLWVVKMQGWRKVGTHDELFELADSEECRDFDLSADQPEHLKDFYEKFWKYSDEHGFITVPDFYEDVYAKRRIWTEDEIRNLIQKNDKVLYGALRRIYAEQTADEQASGETNHQNGVGFNGVDAPILSSFCEFLNRTGFLTPKQKTLARKKLVKYNKQLTRLANA